MARIEDILKRASLIENSVGQPHQFVGMNYADPGAGKTILTMKIAQRIRDNGRVLYLDSNEGFVTLLEDRWAVLREATARIRVDDPAELNAIAEAMISGRAPALKGVTVVVLDELSAWVKRIAEAYSREKYQTPPEKMMHALEGSDWNPIGAAVVAIVDKFIQTGAHVLLVAHSREKGDRDGGSKKYAPNFTPLLNIDLQGLVHQTTLITNRLAGRGQYERKIYTQPSASIQAKSRVEGMPVEPTESKYLDLIEDWTLGKIGTAKALSVLEVVDSEQPVYAPQGDAELPEDQQPYIEGDND